MQGRLLLAAVASAAALGFLAAPAAADAAADGLAKAKESLAKYTAMPQFVAPGEPFDAKKCAAGKKMMSIPNNSANPFLKGIIDREKAAGAKVGLEVTEWENQGQPSQWIQGVELAIRVALDELLVLRAIHWIRSALTRCNARYSNFRARESRDMTVPSGTWVIRAMS